MSCDPHDTFSPVSRITTIRTMMALAAMEGVSIRSGDVPSAYIKADVPPDMDIYMTQLKGFEVKGKEKWYCKLDKALYGIPPAGQCWYDECAGFLKKLGFRQSRTDPCIFIKRDDEGMMVISLTVDDFLEFSTSRKLQEETIAKLTERFDYIDNGPSTWFLGMGIKQDCEKICVSQKDYILTICDEYPEAHKTNCPGDPGSILIEHEGEKENFPYRS
jgi:Reverse transcriptase (RNA-dependent DNA polymerase)